MSAQFSKGDRVRVIDVEGYNSMLPVTLKYGAEHTVEEAGEHLVRVDDGRRQFWKASRFEKVEPEFVVGQQVSASDYARLPVGSVVRHPEAWPITKDQPGWWLHGKKRPELASDSEMAASHHPDRTLTHLGDGTHVTEPSVDNSEDLTEPEDADDLDTLGGLPADDDTPAVRAFVESRVKEDLFEDADDVEPEPLKEGDWCLVWMKYERTDNLHIVHASLTEPSGVGREVYVHPDAIVRPAAGDLPPWVKPIEEPTTLGTVVFCEEGSVFVRVHAYGKKPWARSGFDEHRSWDEIPTVERVVRGGAS